MTNNQDIKNGLLDAIESEMALIVELRRKYQMGFAIYKHMKELVKQQEDVCDGNYWLERRNLDDSCEMITAYFDDGSTMSYRHRVINEQEQMQIG